MLSITVYTQPGCFPCTFTIRRLGDALSEDRIIDLTEDTDAYALVTGLGYKSAPVVVIRDRHGNITGHWAGFNPERIDVVKAAITGILVPVAA